MTKWQWRVGDGGADADADGAGGGCTALLPLHEQLPSQPQPSKIEQNRVSKCQTRRDDADYRLPTAEGRR